MADANAPSAATGDQALIYEPMPESHRITLGVFRQALLDLHSECGAIKRRSRALPYLVTLGLSALTAAVYSVIGIINYDGTDPHPAHKVWVMYFTGATVGGTAAIVLLVLAFVFRGNFKSDLDALMDRINVLNYSSPVLRDEGRGQADV